MENIASAQTMYTHTPLHMNLKWRTCARKYTGEEEGSRVAERVGEQEPHPATERQPTSK